MRPLHLREWPLFHTLRKLGSGTASDVLRALAKEQPADLHSVRAGLRELEDEGYACSEPSHFQDEDGKRVEVVTFFPVVDVETALRTAWLQLRKMMLDDDRYLELFRGIVASEE
jgi:hypothetical protein